MLAYLEDKKVTLKHAQLLTDGFKVLRYQGEPIDGLVAEDTDQATLESTALDLLTAKGYNTWNVEPRRNQYDEARSLIRLHKPG